MKLKAGPKKATKANAAPKLEKPQISRKIGILGDALSAAGLRVNDFARARITPTYKHYTDGERYDLIETPLNQTETYVSNGVEIHLIEQGQEFTLEVHLQGPGLTGSNWTHKEDPQTPWAYQRSIKEPTEETIANIISEELKKYL